MRVALHSHHPSKLWSVACSISLHALLLAAMLYKAAPMAMLSQQQVVEVTLVTLSSIEPDEEKPTEVTKPAPKLEAQTPPAPTRPIIKSDAVPVKRKLEKASQEKPHPTEELAALTPAAGKPKAAKETAQMVVTKPVFDAAYLRNPAPTYPPQAKRRKMEGVVMLDVVVSADGMARSVSVAQSSGFDLLDDSAKDAIALWKFIPAKREGETVEARVMVPIEFKLN